MADRRITVGDHVYPSKRAVADACRSILYGYPSGSPITHEHHRAFLDDLLERHPDAAAKVGCGVLRFESRQNPIFPTQRTLFLVRTDGTETDFSFLKCITPQTHRHLVLKAMRRAIAPQVVAVVEAAFATGAPVACAITGQPLDSRADAHVDHYDPSFIALASSFATSAGDWDAIALHHEDGMLGSDLADTVQRDAWIEYHRVLAGLRVVSIHANLSILRTAASS